MRVLVCMLDQFTRKSIFHLEHFRVYEAIVI